MSPGRVCEGREVVTGEVGIGSSSAVPVENFAAPNVDTIGGIQIKRLPAGAALGAHDLQRWSSNRSGGRSGAYTTKREREILNNWTPVKKQVRDNPAPLSTQECSVTQKKSPQQRAVKRAILVEQTVHGWLVALPDGSHVGPFKQRDDAWSWVARHRSRRYET